jgi:hypothetical protein
MVRNESVRFGRHIDIEVSYKILWLEIPKLVQNLHYLACFQKGLFGGNFSKNTLRLLGVKGITIIISYFTNSSLSLALAIMTGSSMLVWKACAIQAKDMNDFEGTQTNFDSSITCYLANSRTFEWVSIGEDGGGWGCFSVLTSKFMTLGSNVSHWNSRLNSGMLFTISII